MIPHRRGVVELEIEGMTCGACAARVERRLNKVTGVRAEVNYATELATLELSGAASVEDAVAVIEQDGYRASLSVDHSRSASKLPLIRLVSVWVLTAPILVLSLVPLLQFPAWQWVVFAMTVPIVFWCGFPFHRAAARGLRHGTFTTDTLLSLGTLSATIWSTWALLFGDAGGIGLRREIVFFSSGDHEIYFGIAAATTALFLLGRMIESRARHPQSDALDALARLHAKAATRVTDSGDERIPVDELRVGDRFRARAGEKIATDGVVVQGTSTIDTAIITGESMPLAARPGSDVIGGTVNGNRPLLIEATKVGENTELARIAAMLRQAQSRKVDVQRLADRMSSFFVPAVIGIATVTLIAWLLFTGDAEAAFAASAATLIIACPSALGLATPTALLVGTKRGSRLGLLFRNATVLETARRVSVAVLDKTGTLTEGRMRIAAIYAEPYIQSMDLLRIAAAVENNSVHPISQAIVRTAEASGLDIQPAQNIELVTGAGLQGEFEGYSVRVGKPDWIGVDPGKTGALTGTLVAVEYDGAYLGTLMLNDEVRSDAKSTITRLRDLGIEPIMVTGDHQAAADEIAQTVGIDHVHAGALPADKVEHVKRLQADGHQVAMVGDGVNDAAALAEADLGIAMGSGTEVARASASITLTSGGLERAATGIELARATLRIIKQNLFWAFAFNALAIPLAAFGYLSPLFASLAMLLSNLFVVVNSLGLRRFGI